MRARRAAKNGQLANRSIRIAERQRDLPRVLGRAARTLPRSIERLVHVRDVHIQFESREVIHRRRLAKSRPKNVPLPTPLKLNRLVARLRLIGREGTEGTDGAFEQ